MTMTMGSETGTYRVLLLFVVCAIVLFGAASCSPPGATTCATDGDCDPGYECVSSGGVVFGESLCLLSNGPSDDAAIGDDGASDVASDVPSGDTDGSIGDGGGGTDADDVDACDSQTFYLDADGDGYGDPSQSVDACTVPTDNSGSDYLSDDTDCDDSNEAIYPGVEETCDGVDNNCNGVTDEQCPCTAGDTRPCGTDEGTCEQGVQTGSGGQWAILCDGETGTSADICDELDNDCDGEVDELIANKGDACTVGQGECEAAGAYVCTQFGSGTECDAVAGTPARNETCGDGLDNDCNGQVDDGCPCDYNGTSEGVCENGALQEDGSCDAPEAYDSEEVTCDGLDNDCNGEVDEGLTEPRFPDADGDGFGDPDGEAPACPGAAGWVDNDTDCDDGDPWTYPDAVEICDGEDNNCNGYAFDAQGPESDAWCGQHFNVSEAQCVGIAGPGSDFVCCDSTGNSDCDLETICDNGIDEDNDGDADCADSDCDGLSCESGKTCQSGSCLAI